MKNKKLALVTGAALAAFAAGSVQAAQVAKTKELSVKDGILLADGKDGCGADGGCSGDMKKDSAKAKGAKDKKSMDKAADGKDTKKEDKAE